MSMSEPTVTEQFKDFGISASCHYADDTCKEWGIADRDKAKALKLFDDNPSLQEEMREIAKGFLWSFSMERGNG